MKIKLSKEFYLASSKEGAGVSVWKALGVVERNFGYGGTLELDLRGASTQDGQALLALCTKHNKLPKVRACIADLKVWVKASSGEKGILPKNVKQFETLVRELLRRTPGHRVFLKEDDGWWCYYVSSTSYSPPRGSGDNYHPPYCTLHYKYQEFGGIQTSSTTFYARDCLHADPETTLRSHGVYLETPELRTMYLAQLTHFDSLNGKLGLQCNAGGYGESLAEKESWRTRTVKLDREEGAARVVIDVFSEKDDTRTQKAEKVTGDFWLVGKQHVEEDSDDNDDEEAVEVEEEEDLPEGVVPAAPLPKPQEIEVPWHPMLVVFDLQKHQRIKVHADNLSVYQYDTKLGSKLVLPVEIQSFITMLTSYTGAFTDIIKGKGSGLTVLLAGPSGTGKTLTSQVYSEVLKRPLYSVQASQLGLDAAELEESILRAFARAQRWNAILLIDEADVYVSARGSDLVQNAIVGVFLRVMEYYDGVLFMTTNSSAFIDDAIASRCVAKIEFRPPEKEGQIKLWGVLAEVMGMTAQPADVLEIVKNHPKFTGRDIKNILKLLKLTTPPDVASSPVTLNRVNFVRAFKPTT